jgi:hypothetical protein
MLFACALAIVGVGLVTLFSAADQSIARVRPALSLTFAVTLMWLFANVAPQTLARRGPALHARSRVLVSVALFGIVVNGRGAGSTSASHVSSRPS